MSTASTSSAFVSSASFSAYESQFAEQAGYLNFARFGPPSRAAVERATGLMQTAITGAVGTVDRMHDEDLRARSAFARLSGFDVSRVTLVPNTSLGLFQVAFGAPGTTLVSRGEFPANLYPWLRGSEAGLTDARLFGAVGVPVTPEAVAEALASAARAGVEVAALAVSAVDFRTGFRADLAELRALIGPERLLIVDGIQGFGAVDLPWSLADVLVVGGQKWLRAGWGGGALAFSEAGLARIRPVLGGWTGVVDPGVHDGTEHPVRGDALRFSITNLSPFATGAFATALELVESVGIARIEQRIVAGVDALLAAFDGNGVTVLSPRPPAERAGIVVAGLARAAEAHEALAAAGIDATLHGTDRVRFAVHATTAPSAFAPAARILAAHA